MSALVHEAGTVSGRTTVMLLTTAFHIVLIAGLMVTRLTPVLEVAPSHLIWVPVEPEKPNPAPRADVNARNDWRPSTPKPVMPDVPFEKNPVETIATVPESTGTGSAEPTDVATTIRSTAIDYRAARPTDAFYPAASIRVNEVGVVVVKVCVSASGQLDPRPQVSSSSGYPRLDGAAIRWVQEGARFTPATRNGEPVADCKPMRVNFTLKGGR
jgi:TonB family protein